MTAFTGVDSQNLPDVMVSVQFILAIGENYRLTCEKQPFFKKIAKIDLCQFFIKNSSIICFEHWKALLEKKVNV
ncbi:hypothetical protein LOB44_06690 [Lactobacillus delbrueckii subsp. lactis]|uniref:hypothetical protein n=1 Tax=Lactobacillus delbrueckii TaxID=1584 RepID=UPI001E3627EE|nr:hypothetical protein [Lactobacillus delbrueckii]MCD5514380.1 hypothetical protein [Lactobacillus delbrueckii subsp. lactis]